MSIFDSFFGAVADFVLADAGASDSCSAVAMPSMSSDAGSAGGGCDWSNNWGTAADHQPAAEAWSGSSAGCSFDGSCGGAGEPW